MFSIGKNHLILGNKGKSELCNNIINITNNINIYTINKNNIPLDDLKKNSILYIDDYSSSYNLDRYIYKYLKDDDITVIVNSSKIKMNYILRIYFDYIYISYIEDKKNRYLLYSMYVRNYIKDPLVYDNIWKDRIYNNPYDFMILNRDSLSYGWYNTRNNIVNTKLLDIKFSINSIINNIKDNMNIIYYNYIRYIWN